MSAKKTTKKRGRPRKQTVEPPKADVPAQPERKELRILRGYPNPRLVMADNGNGNQIVVEVPARFKQRVIGKVIECERIDGLQEERYKYVP